MKRTSEPSAGPAVDAAEAGSGAVAPAAALAAAPLVARTVMRAARHFPRTGSVLMPYLPRDARDERCVSIAWGSGAAGPGRARPRAPYGLQQAGRPPQDVELGGGDGAGQASQVGGGAEQDALARREPLDFGQRRRDPLRALHRLGPPVDHPEPEPQPVGPGSGSQQAEVLLPTDAIDAEAAEPFQAGDTGVQAVDRPPLEVEAQGGRDAAPQDLPDAREDGEVLLAAEQHRLVDLQERSARRLQGAQLLVQGRRQRHRQGARVAIGAILGEAREGVRAGEDHLDRARAPAPRAQLILDQDPRPPRQLRLDDRNRSVRPAPVNREALLPDPDS